MSNRDTATTGLTTASAFIEHAVELISEATTHDADMSPLNGQGAPASTNESTVTLPPPVRRLFSFSQTQPSNNDTAVGERGLPASPISPLQLRTRTETAAPPPQSPKKDIPIVKESIARRQLRKIVESIPCSENLRGMANIWTHACIQTQFMLIADNLVIRVTISRRECVRPVINCKILLLLDFERVGIPIDVDYTNQELLLPPNLMDIGKSDGVDLRSLISSLIWHKGKALLYNYCAAKRSRDDEEDDDEGRAEGDKPFSAKRRRPNPAQRVRRKLDTEKL